MIKEVIEIILGRFGALLIHIQDQNNLENQALAFLKINS